MQVNAEINNFLMQHYNFIIKKYVQRLGVPELQTVCSYLLVERRGIALAESFLQHNREPPPTNPQHWCASVQCRPMQTPRENKCCGYRTCNTTFEDFHLICLEHSVLMVAIHNCANIMANPIKYSPTNYRKAEYGHLGRGNLRIKPLCVVWCVRDKYTAPDGQYLGFRDY